MNSIAVTNSIPWARWRGGSSPLGVVKAGGKCCVLWLTIYPALALSAACQSAHHLDRVRMKQAYSVAVFSIDHR